MRTSAPRPLGRADAIATQRLCLASSKNPGRPGIRSVWITAGPEELGQLGECGVCAWNPDCARPTATPQPIATKTAHATQAVAICLNLSPIAISTPPERNRFRCVDADWSERYVRASIVRHGRLEVGKGRAVARGKSDVDVLGHRIVADDREGAALPFDVEATGVAVLDP